jgi:hypothetical protein
VAVLKVLYLVAEKGFAMAESLAKNLAMLMVVYLDKQRDICWVFGQVDNSVDYSVSRMVVKKVAKMALMCVC